MIVLSVLVFENDLGMVASDRELIGNLESIAKLKNNSKPWNIAVLTSSASAPFLPKLFTDDTKTN